MEQDEELTMVDFQGNQGKKAQILTMDDVLSDCEEIQNNQITGEIWNTQGEEKKRVDSVSVDQGKVAEPLQDYNRSEQTFSIECLNAIISEKH